MKTEEQRRIIEAAAGCDVRSCGSCNAFTTFAAAARKGWLEALDKLDAVLAVAQGAGCNLPTARRERCGECGNCRTLAILEEQAGE